MEEWFSKKLVIITSLFLIIIMGIGVWYLSKRVEENRYIQFSDTLRNYFRNKLDSQKSQALSLAIALAENKALKEALWDDDEDLGYEILSKTLMRLREYTLMRDVRAQVITTDLTIFARSWDNTYAGMPLDIFREDLKEITTLKKPKVAIEPGRLLSIKATTPIMQGAKAIGYLEILQFFDKITDDLRQKHIELLVLMNEKLLDIATLMRENPTVQNFVVSNKNYNVNLLKIVNSIPLAIAKGSVVMHSFGITYFFGGASLSFFKILLASGISIIFLRSAEYSVSERENASSPALSIKLLFRCILTPLISVHRVYGYINVDRKLVKS